MKQVLLFGGTFNPIHNGHMAMLNCLVCRSYDEILVMPDCLPPHKTGRELASDAHRLAMCRLAVADWPGVTVCDSEIKRGGKSYTIDTVRTLLSGGDRAVTVAVGGDMLLDLPHWKQADELKTLCRFVAFGRTGQKRAVYEAAAEEMNRQGWKITLLKADLPDVSSTLVRQRAEQCLTLDGLVPQAVADYVAFHRLYRDVATDYAAYHSVLQANLDEARYTHSLGVAWQAERLAKRYGADSEQAYAAGLLHDVTKRFSKEEQLALLHRHGVTLTPTEQASPQLWHAMTAPLFVKEQWGIREPDFLNALRYHTTGRAGMSLLEKIVYLADFTSPDRTYPDVERVRELADVSLEAAAFYTLRYTVSSLSAQGRPIHPHTLEAYNELSVTEGEEYHGSH